MAALHAGLSRCLSSIGEIQSQRFRRTVAMPTAIIRLRNSGFTEARKLTAQGDITRPHHGRRRFAVKNIPGSLESPLFRNLAVWIPWESGVGKEVKSICQALLCNLQSWSAARRTPSHYRPSLPAGPAVYTSVKPATHHISPAIAAGFAPIPGGG